MRFTFMKQDTFPPDYYQFSRFLMETDLSQIAKILYMLLLDRTDQAVNENWIDRMGNAMNKAAPTLDKEEKLWKKDDMKKLLYSLD